MKKTVLIIGLISSVSLYSQVALGKAVAESASSSIEFGNANRGIVLPWVTDAASMQNVVNGTLAFDLTDKKVKSYQNNTWIDLSVDGTGVADSTLQDALNENPAAKVAIGLR